MYHLSCDGYPLLDWRDNDLILVNPKVKLEVNTVGEGSFMIYKEHPYYDKLKKLKSIFEVSDEIGVIFRGRMTGNTIDFDNGKAVDLEGVMAFFNDSIIRPFSFPEDFSKNEGYIAAAKSGNVAEFFLGWLIEQHNSQVQDFQKLRLGNVTVSDPNNFISRSSTEYASTWETLKSKLFDSSLGGYLCARYEDDGTYIDYLESFELINTQKIVYGENLLDLTNEENANETYSAIIPQGKDGLNIKGLADGKVKRDIVKSGDTLYSEGAVESYGWIYAPVKETTWDDVTVAQNLLDKGAEWLITQGVKLSNTIEVTAVDLHFTDEEIRSFRIYRDIQVISTAHGFEEIYPLTRLDIDLLNPQNTKITVGRTQLTLTDKQNAATSNTELKIESSTTKLQEEVSSTKQEVLDLKEQIEGVEGLYFYIKYSPYSDGHIMTNVPDVNTLYIGTCSTSEETAPTDSTKYTWCRVKGEQGVQGEKGDKGDKGDTGTPGATGADGRTQYLHIKYSDDGETFTANNGEELGAWIGTLVDFNEADSTTFGDYTWKKFTEDVDDELERLDQRITESTTTVFNDCNEILLTALKSYVETSNFEEFKETLKAELEVFASGITGRVSATEESIKNVDGDLQAKFNMITKYFTFDINGLTIGQVDNPNKVVIDNDDISILVNNVPVQEFKADGTALIPILKITQILNLLGLQITEDATHINCDYVGV